MSMGARPAYGVDLFFCVARFRLFFCIRFSRSSYIKRFGWFRMGLQCFSCHRRSDIMGLSWFIVILAVSAATNAYHEDLAEIIIERIDQDFADGLSPDDGLFGLRLSKKKEKRLIQSPSIHPVDSQDQSQPILYTLPAAFKKEPSVHNSFKIVETTTTSSITEQLAYNENSAADSFQSFFEPVGSKPPTEQIDKKPWLSYLAEQDEQQAGHEQQSSRPLAGSNQQSFFSLPPYGASNEQTNQEYTPTPSSVTAIYSPPTPGLSYSYLVLGSTEAPQQDLSAPSPAQKTKLPPLPLIPLAFREPKNLGNSAQPVRDNSAKPIVLNLKGETWGPPFKVANGPKVEQFKSSETSDPHSTSGNDNLGFFIQPTAFRASNALASFSSDPIKPSFTLKTFPVSQVFAEPTNFKPLSKTQESLWEGKGPTQTGVDFQDDVLAFIRSHNNFNAALSLKSTDNNQNQGVQNHAITTPSYPSSPSYPSQPSYPSHSSPSYPSPSPYSSSLADPPSYPTNTPQPSYPSSTAPSYYPANPEPVTTYKPPTSQTPAPQTNYSTQNPTSASYGVPAKSPEAPYAPPPSYSPPVNQITEQFTPSEAAPSKDFNKKPSASNSLQSLPYPYALPSPNPVVAVTVSTSAPQTVVGPQSPSNYAPAPSRPSTPAAPLLSIAPAAQLAAVRPPAQQLPRPIVGLYKQTDKFQTTSNVAVRPANPSPAQYNQQPARLAQIPVRQPPVPSPYISPPKNVNYANAGLTPRDKQINSRFSFSSNSQTSTRKPVQVYLTYG